jgi:hypothetical protein
VQKLFALLALVAGLSTTAVAQQSWQAEIGIQGGVLKVKPAGTGADDAINFLQLPGGTFYNGIFGTPPLFAVIPWKGKMAVEAQFGLLQLTGTGTTGHATVVTSTLRLDYALSPKFYVAAGPTHRWVQASGNHDGQLGATAAAGYRMKVTSRLNGRIEGGVVLRKKDDSSAPVNTYFILAGLSSRLGSSARSAARPAASRRAWQSVIGIQGGYLNQHTVGGASDVTGFQIPGVGNDILQAGLAIGSPPAVFAILPIGDKVAVEVGFDAHANKVSGGGGSGTAITASARLDYALRGGWYAAGGVNFTNINVGGRSGTITGGQVAWGHRFHLTGDLGGRVELLYDLRSKNADTGTPPVNTFGVMFGVTMPLK